MNQKSLDKLSLCKNGCYCMTKTINNKCGKCGKVKSLDKKKEFELIFGLRKTEQDGSGYLGFRPTVTVEDVWNWIEKSIKESYELGYYKGVSDEIKCVETSGEHLDLQIKLNEIYAKQKFSMQKPKEHVKYELNTSKHLTCSKTKELMMYTNVSHKELEWEKQFDDEFGTFGDDAGPMVCQEPLEEVKQFIRNTLTQQRTELLEEIKGIICEVVHKEKHDDINGVYVHENEPNYLVDCSATEAQCYNSGAVDQSLKIREKLFNLLNKKDEK